MGTCGMLFRFNFDIYPSISFIIFKFLLNLSQMDKFWSEMLPTLQRSWKKQSHHQHQMQQEEEEEEGVRRRSNHSNHHQDDEKKDDDGGNYNSNVPSSPSSPSSSSIQNFSFGEEEVMWAYTNYSDVYGLLIRKDVGELIAHPSLFIVGFVDISFVNSKVQEMRLC